MDSNLHTGTSHREFFVWVPSSGFMIENNLGRVGMFVGGPFEPDTDTPDSLMFIENPKLKPNLISPFHMGITTAYRTEYNLELQRYWGFKRYPSRFFALFLLDNVEDARTYIEIHPDHVAGRVLKRGVTVGPYRYSEHDSGWIDFLRLGHGLGDDTINKVSDAYWSGRQIQDCQLMSFGKPWIQKPSTEILFYGKLFFPNRDLSKSDIELGS